jgi:hypothetical protein
MSPNMDPDNLLAIADPTGSTGFDAEYIALTFQESDDEESGEDEDDNPADEDMDEDPDEDAESNEEDDENVVENEIDLQEPSEGSEPESAGMNVEVA